MQILFPFAGQLENIPTKQKQFNCIPSVARKSKIRNENGKRSFEVLRCGFAMWARERKERFSESWKEVRSSQSDRKEAEKFHLIEQTCFNFQAPLCFFLRSQCSWKNSKEKPQRIFKNAESHLLLRVQFLPLLYRPLQKISQHCTSSESRNLHRRSWLKSLSQR